MNHTSFYGRISSDVDYRVNGDKGVARFSIAVNRRTKEHKADFFRIVAFGKTAELINNNFRKGSRIALECTAVQPEKYTNQQGQTIYPNVEFWVTSLDFVDTKAESGQTSAPTQAAAPQTGTDDFMSVPEGIDTELPFS